MKFNNGVAKGLKLKVRKFLELIPTFVEVGRGKLVGGAFLPNRVNANLLELISRLSKYYFQACTICLLLLSSQVFTALEFDNNHYFGFYLEK